MTKSNHDILIKKIPDYRNAIIVARTPGQAKRATAFAERLALGIAVIHGGDVDSQPEGESLDDSTGPGLSALKSRFKFSTCGLVQIKII